MSVGNFDPYLTVIDKNPWAGSQVLSMAEEITEGVELPLTTEPRDIGEDLLKTVILTAMFAKSSVSWAAEKIGIHPEVILYHLRNVKKEGVAETNTYLKDLAFPSRW